MKTTFRIWENSYNSRNGKKVPTLVIEDETGRELFLQPFRYYRMQLSGTINQIGSYGESEVLGLLNLTLTAMIKEELIDKNEKLKDIDGFQCSVPMLNGLINDLSLVAIGKYYDSETVRKIWYNPEWDKFINETVQYLKVRCNELTMEMAATK